MKKILSKSNKKIFGKVELYTNENCNNVNNAAGCSCCSGSGGGGGTVTPPSPKKPLPSGTVCIAM